MGPAIQAVGDVRTFLAHNPIIAVLGTVASIVIGGVGVMGPLGLFNAVLQPLLLGGMLGLVWAGRSGDAAPHHFLVSAKGNFLTLFGGYALAGLAMFGAVMIPVSLTVLATVVLGASLAGPAGGPAGSALAGLPVGGLLSGLGVLAFVVVGVAVLLVALLGVWIQLFDVAVVAEDRGVVRGFDRAWRLFRAAPTSVLGYSVIRGALGALGVVPVVAFFGLGVGVGLQGAVLYAVLAVLTMVFVPLAFVLGQTYHVAYFNRLTARVG